MTEQKQLKGRRVFASVMQNCFVKEPLSHPVEEFNYLGVLFTRDGVGDGSMDQGPFLIIRVLFRPVKVKKELSR